MGEILWDLDAIDMGIRQARIYADSSLENAYNPQKNLTKSFWEKIYKKYHATIQDHIVIFMYGTQGLGKSSVGIEILENNGIYTTDNIGFSNDEILDIAKSKKVKTIIMRDESIDLFGVGSKRLEATVGNTIETCRKAGLSFIFLKPVFEKIAGVHLVLEVLQRNMERRITHCALRDTETNYCIGFVLFDIKPTNDESTPELAKHKQFWEEYNKKKDIFIENITQQSIGATDITGRAKAVLKLLHEQDPDERIYIKKQERLLFIKEQFPNFTIKELELIRIKVEQLIRLEKEEGVEEINNN